jgi:hypothetical protein
LLEQKGQRRCGTGADGVNPTFDRVKVFIRRSIERAVARDLTYGAHAAMVGDGASTPHANQAISP